MAAFCRAGVIRLTPEEAIAADGQRGRQEVSISWNDGGSKLAAVIEVIEATAGARAGGGGSVRWGNPGKQLEKRSGKIQEEVGAHM
jgi:hypothetical protein